jgi:glucuronate isomerase
MPNDVFITDDFLLETDEARELYHGHAEGMPIVDYHCHLSPKWIAENHRFRNLTEAWLGGDHYKWRAMRSNGIPERYCTGDAADWDKFQKWAETVPYLLRNPLYDWTHLELKRYFGIGDRLLGPDTARGIWEACNAQFAGPGFSCRELMERSRVEVVCTTDDPTDTLEHHRAIREDASFGVRVLPTWRPDRGMTVEDPAAFTAWVDKLAAAANLEIGDFSSYVQALAQRHAFFHEMGCRLSDHGVETIHADDYTEEEIRSIFHRARGGMALDGPSIRKFKSAMLYHFGIMDCECGWTQQFHLGAMRNNNTRMMGVLGPDSGFDSVSDARVARPLARLLDRLDRTGDLAKTVLYNLNPADNLVLVTMLGNFQDGSVPGKIQYGSAWWFLDHKDGMERQIEDLSNCGLLSRFVGMLTDSRSFLSYTRHEYFRRMLCNVLGRDMRRGRMPRDMALVGRMVRDICYHNAVNYFGFDVGKTSRDKTPSRRKKPVRG